jgi:squalene-hopene/tetraprenyl-beta-curcumene cyclase
MKRKSRTTGLWRPSCDPVAFVLLVFASGIFASGQETKPTAQIAKLLPNSPEEPLRPKVSLAAAAAFLDTVALDWTRQRKCGTCHTNYPYLVARPVLQGPATPAMAEVRGFFEERVAHWDDAEKGAKPRWDAEVVSTAAALAMNDFATTGKLHPRTRQALDRVWKVQKPDGGFDWLKCGWPPLEHDDYYGAIVAALGVGYATEGYSSTSAAVEGVKRLRAYFSKNRAPSFHHRVMLLWASMRIEGLMTAAERSSTIARLRDLQRADGGWNLPSLVDWKRHDGSANDPAGASDGYATGLSVFVLREAGIPASDPCVRRGVAWLTSNQRASGRWFTRSLSTDLHHFITHAGTAFAVLALRSCDIAGAETASRDADRVESAPGP